ncbi:MAG: (deoxy)nucleoside triphosphate pyrophosphohydrolase [Treponema sp.]|nr:(deoxy)nucleoside triphosphate pyrophosphohydrolase [Treponema sp.]
MKVVHVSAAVIWRASGSGPQVLATQRGYGPWKDWWEFPGGKIEAGESAQEALVREIREELKAAISVQKYLGTTEWDYPDFHLKMECFLAALAGQDLFLLEHEAARWLCAEQLDSVNWLPADKEILPAVRRELLALS